MCDYVYFVVVVVASFSFLFLRLKREYKCACACILFCEIKEKSIEKIVHDGHLGFKALSTDNMKTNGIEKKKSRQDSNIYWSLFDLSHRNCVDEVPDTRHSTLDTRH